MESPLRLYFFGTYRVEVGARPTAEFESNKVRALLAYLAVEAGKYHSRDALAGLLWPDVPDTIARKNLRQALSNLRKAIGDAKATPPYLEISRYQLRFNPESAVWSDVAEFSSLLQSVTDHHHRHVERCYLCAHRLQRGIDLYQGEFLAGLHVDQNRIFDEWLVLTRERLHRQAIQALKTLITYYEQRGDLKAALRCTNTLVQLDPWREEAYYTLMRLLAANGERSAALQAYKRCQAILRDEFDTDPLPETYELWQAIKKGTLGFSPPAPPPTNLPTALTPLVGRERELAQLSERLLNPDCHLLTLTGVGGVGKTRLALELGKRARYSFPDGVYWVSLAEIETVDALPHAIANVLQTPLRGAQEPVQELANRLNEQEMLLILDNFEHLLCGATMLAAWIRVAPMSVFLVTSRHPLRLQAEDVFHVPGLSYPPADKTRQAGHFDAVRLFVECARRTNSSLEFGEESLKNAARICQLVEGLPLPIELAAAWTRRLPLSQIIEKIQAGLDVYTTSWPDLPERHRSLRSTFEQSWRLLSVEEQQVLARLSVFRGSFSQQASKEVTEATNQNLLALLDASLLQRQTAERFSLHSVVRQFAWEKLNHEGKSMRSRHARYYASFLQQCFPLIISDEQVNVLHRIEADWDNVAAAWNWAIRQQDTALLADMLRPLHLYLEVRGHYALGIELFTRAAEALAEADNAALLRHQLRTIQAIFMITKGDHDMAETLLLEGLEFFQSQGEREEEAFVLQHLGYLEYHRGNFPAAQTILEEALEKYYSLENACGISDTLNLLGLVLYMMGDYERAEALSRESLALYQEIGAPGGMGKRYNNLALVKQARGDYAQAQLFYTQAMACWEDIDYPLGKAIAHNNLGLLMEAQGKYEEALLHYEQGMEVCQHLNHLYGLAAALNNTGNIYSHQGDYDQAQYYYTRALEARRKLGDQRGLMNVLNNLGEIARLQGVLSRACECWTQVLDQAPKYNLFPVAIDAIGNIAELLTEQGNFAHAALLWGYVASSTVAVQVTRERAQQSLDEIATQLSTPDFQAQKARGEKLSFEEACALAKELLHSAVGECQSPD